ncbi:hypothetical protein FB451DRAFT_1401007 [Mycena latifolia]|nr:hypothetical protein FB451DRAFT_1401007 [Mycena latifolia]
MSDSSASSFMSASSDLPSQWWDTEHKTTSVLFKIGSIGQWNQAKAKKILIGAIIFLVTGGIITTIIIFALRLRENNDYAAYGTYVDGSTENGEPSVQDW